MKIWIVNAFASGAFMGNPAGVCLVESFPSQELMQNIAYQLNFSETAFIVPLNIHQHYHIRWFSPVSEAPLCGHATIASVHVMREMGIVNSANVLTFEGLSGVFTVQINKDGWITLNFPCYDVQEVVIEDIIKRIIRHSTLNYCGCTHNSLLLEFASAADVIALEPDLELFLQLPYRALIITAAYNSQYDFVSRYFAPRVGIREDPVCGSSYCTLIPYWTKKMDKHRFIAYHASKRGGVVRGESLKNERRVLISGQAATFLQGNLRL